MKAERKYPTNQPCPGDEHQDGNKRLDKERAVNRKVVKNTASRHQWIHQSDFMQHCGCTADIRIEIRRIDLMEDSKEIQD